jgi:hypothetical protein
MTPETTIREKTVVEEGHKEARWFALASSALFFCIFALHAISTPG